MNEEMTARLALPLLNAGQAQKETTHNEALTLLDLLAQPVVVAVGVNTPPADPVAGQCWIVGAAPVDAWDGQAQAIAGWTSGGWRFCLPVSGMRFWSLADAADARYDGSGWTVGALFGARLEINGLQVVGARLAAIAEPTGGTVVDAEARFTIAALLAALHTHGLIAV